MSPSGPVFQNSVYVGINLQDILYGVELVLYFKTMHALLFRGRRRRKSDVFYAIFSTVMLILTTIYVATQALFGEMMWLVHTNYEGGADAYWEANYSVWYMGLGSTAIAVLQLMTDGLMIYRCRMLWDSYQVVALPILLWVGTLVLSVLVLWTSSSPGGNFFAGFAAQLGLAYYSVSVGLTLILTLSIGYLIATHGWRIKEHLGQDFASVYFAMLSLLVESVLPYSLSGLAFLVSFGVGSNTSIAFANVYVMMMCISPQMLILQVASGKAMKDDTSDVRPSTLRFRCADSLSVWAESRGCEDQSSGTLCMDARKPTGEEEEV